jgi:hypothetical protein
MIKSTASSSIDMMKATLQSVGSYVTHSIDGVVHDSLKGEKHKDNHEKRGISFLSSSFFKGDKHSKFDAVERAGEESAWQAQALALDDAVRQDIQPSMQGFLCAPKSTSYRYWVVLDKGIMTVYMKPEDTATGTYKARYSMSGAVCRGLDQPKGFEMSIPERTKSKWLSFWCESEAHCKAWILAFQHSANLLDGIASYNL